MPVIFDIEAWSYANSQLPITVSEYLEVIRVFKQSDTGALGFYGVVPNNAYTWENIEPAGGSNYVKWQALNTALTPIAEKADLFFPSFYTHDNDTVSWKSFVDGHAERMETIQRSQAGVRLPMAPIPRWQLRTNTSTWAAPLFGSSNCKRFIRW